MFIMMVSRYGWKLTSLCVRCWPMWDFAIWMSDIKGGFIWEGHTTHLKLNALYSLYNRSSQIKSSSYNFPSYFSVVLLVHFLLPSGNSLYLYPFIFKKQSCSKSHPTESNLGHLLFGQNIVLLASGITIIQEHTYCFTYSCVVFYVLI